MDSHVDSTVSRFLYTNSQIIQVSSTMEIEWHQIYKIYKLKKTAQYTKQTALHTFMPYLYNAVSVLKSFTHRERSSQKTRICGQAESKAASGKA